MSSTKTDSYINTTIGDGYRLEMYIASGRKGVVYKAVKESIGDVLACKIVLEDDLPVGWERELKKVALLRRVPEIVQFHGTGIGTTEDGEKFRWLLWDYIDGHNLRDYMVKFPDRIDMGFIEDFLRTMLKVFYAFQDVGISHGDLHSGNIMVANPDPRDIEATRPSIVVTDFGYGGSSGPEPKPDYSLIHSIVLRMMNKLDQSQLTARDKIMYAKVQEFLKKFREVECSQGEYVGNLRVLYEEFRQLGPHAQMEANEMQKGRPVRASGDYLVAEALGTRADEWKTLFVPQFLAARDLLSKNTTVLTGARGCGKTMIFRRLTTYMDEVIGEPSGVEGASQFNGFYLNCRDLIEAFPWIPRKKQLSPKAQEQIVHYFHLACSAEIVKTLIVKDPENKADYEWLNRFFVKSFGAKYIIPTRGASILEHAYRFIDDRKEECRLADLGRRERWPLGSIDYLDRFQQELSSNVLWVNGLPSYMFLDDYTTPYVPSQVQKTLNPVIFKRRSDIFFKISTEAANSFELENLYGKPLELDHDFELIDLATESLHVDDDVKFDLLDKIFRPRIKREPIYREQELGLVDILGKTPYSYTDLAYAIRDRSDEGKKKVIYHGHDVFSGMWSSDVRMMIQIFKDMLREASNDIDEINYQIPTEIQDKCYRTAGGEFLRFTEHLQDPFVLTKGLPADDPIGSYGTHLRNIAEAFVNVAKYELTEGPKVSNQGRLNPRQSFRIEITDKFELPDDAQRYYVGLVRWHVFMQDWRGKSVRGMFTPRLYLNRVLIPISNLTFSKHDNIHLSIDDFIHLLMNPTIFFEFYKDKKSSKPKYDQHRNQRQLLPEGEGI